MQRIIAILMVLAFLCGVGCMTTRQNLYDEKGDTAKSIADVLGRYQAATIDNALQFARDGRGVWDEARSLYLIEITGNGTLEDPLPQRKLDWYTNVINSIDADIKFLTALKAKADALGKPAPASGS